MPEDLLAGLVNEDFRTREDAQAQLLDWARETPDSNSLTLLKVARENPEPEVRQRAYNVLRSMAMDVYLSEGEGYMGIQMLAIRMPILGEDELGQVVISITRVMADSPAQNAGLRVGDVITSVNNQTFKPGDELNSFQLMIRELKPGKPATFNILRGQESMDVVVVLGRRPPMLEQRFFGQQLTDLNELARRDQDEFFQKWLQNLEK